MDVEYPFADGPSRLRLLYRLPSAPRPQRLLLIADAPGSESIGVGWPGPVTVLASSALDAAVRQGEGRFDAVALPWSLGPQFALARSASARDDLLRSAYRLLVPGGVVVGHLENMHTLRRLTRLRGLGEMLRAARLGAVGGPSRCRSALLRSGFSDAECYYVQPSIDSPMGLIPCERGPARAQFLRSIRSSEGHYGRTAYTLRWLVAFLGLGGMQQSELFFWARRAC